MSARLSLSKYGRSKEKLSKTGSDSCRSKADSRSHERNPLTETAAGQKAPP